MSSEFQGTYRPASRLAHWASTLFVASAAVAAVLALLDAYQLALLSVIRHGGTIPSDLATAQDVRQRLITELMCGIEVAALISFFLWLYRISQNAWSLGAKGLKYTPAWSVGWFFVPIAGLFVPYYVVYDLWKVSSSGPSERLDDAPRFPILGFWWAISVANAVIQYSPLQVALGQEKIAMFSDPLLNTTWADNLWEFFWGRLLSDAVVIAWSILTVVVVLRLTNLQKRRRAEVDELAGANNAPVS